MANSGSFNTTDYSGRYLTFSWSIKSQSTANNETVISWTLKGAGTSAYGYYNAAPFKLVINGATVYESSTRIQLYNGTTVAKGETIIKHNTDGKKTFTASATAAIYSYSVNCSGSGSWELTPIARAATLTTVPASFDDEQTNITINYSNPAGTNVTKILACISATGSVDDIKYREIERTQTSYTFTLTEEDKKTLRKSVTKQDGTSTVYFILRTYIGDDWYNTYKTSEYRLINFTPTITPTIRETYGASIALTGSEYKIIKGYNYVEYDIGAAARKEATITNQRITCGSQTTTEPTGILFGVDSGVFELRTIDNRNTITEKTVTLDLVDYKPLTCQLNASIALDEETTSKISFSGSGYFWNNNFGARDNAIRLEYRIKTNNGAYGTPKPLAASVSGNGYSFSGTISGLDYRNNYTIQVIAYDELLYDGITSKEIQLSTIPIFDYGEDSFNFNVPITINNQELDYVVERGTSGMWTYEKYKSGLAKCWGTIMLTTAINKAWGSMYVGNTVMSRINYPFAFTSKPTETLTLQAGSSAAWIFAESNGNGVNGTHATAVYNVCRPSTATENNYYLSFNVIGRWK